MLCPLIRSISSRLCSHVRPLLPLNNLIHLPSFPPSRYSSFFFYAVIACAHLVRGAGLRSFVPDLKGQSVSFSGHNGSFLNFEKPSWARVGCFFFVFFSLFLFLVGEGKRKQQNMPFKKNPTSAPVFFSFFFLH